MKKIMTLLASAVLLFSMAACGTNSNASDASAAGNTAADGATKLTVWCWDPTFNIYAVEEAAKIYNVDNPDVEIEVVEVPWDQIQVAVTTAGQAGDYSTLPDILLMQNNAFQKNTTNFPDMFVDLTESGINFEDFGESVREYSVVDGKNYGVPFDNGTAISGLRIDVLEQAGYTIDDFTDITWEEYITLGKDVYDKTGKSLLSGVSGEADTVMMMLQSAGGSLFNADGTVNFTNNPVLEESINIYVEMVKNNVFVEVNSWDEHVSTFVNGNVAGVVNGCWILGSVQSAADQAGKWAITNLPKLNVDGGTNYSANGGSSWAVTSNAKNPELAMDFLNKTFAGSVELYETILPSSGAIANYLPAAESPVYQEPQEFFGGDAIYAKIVDFSKKVPSNYTGVYYYEARAALSVAITQIINGTPMADALQEAQSTVEFEMS